MSTSRMPKNLPRNAQGSHRDDESPVNPDDSRTVDMFAKHQREMDDRALRSMAQLAVAKFGGQAAVCKALGEPDTYVSKLSEMLSGAKPVQARVLDLLMSDPQSGPIVLAHFEARAKRDQHTAEQFTEDSAAFFALNPSIGEIFRAYVVDKRGIRPSQVRL